MDPQIKSIITSIGMTAATAATTWGVAHGLVPAADQASLSNALVTLTLAVITGLLGWLKMRQTSPKAMIQAINAGDNGVKVVAASTPASAVPGPLKEPSK